MIWKTTNGLGQEVTWYSEDEVKKIKDTLQKAIDPDTKEHERIIHTCRTYVRLEELLEVKNGQMHRM